MKILILLPILFLFGCTTNTMSSQSREVVRNVVQSSKPKLKSCYDAAVKKDPDMEGTLVSKFSIDKTGRVISSEVDSEKSTIKNLEMIECVKKEISNLYFPELSPEDTNRDITFPFVFNKEQKPTPSK